MASSACEACGWLAAGVSALGFGSFGVPIKGAPIALDPLVFQSYKTTMCFISSWLVLAWGDEFVFSPWGIVSGLFWVPGGVATVYAIQAAGLAIGIGIGSSFIVLVSFIWGIFIFEERVHSRVGASIAILCMMLGLLGMSYFSSPMEPNADATMINGEDDEQELVAAHAAGRPTALASERSGTPTGGHVRVRTRTDSIQYQGLAAATVTDYDMSNNIHGDLSDPIQSLDTRHDVDEHDENDADSVHGVVGVVQDAPWVIVCGRKMSRRHVGMLSAMFTGCYGGSIMAPMKYAPANAKGTHFLISFAIGSALVNVALWLIRYGYHWYECANAAHAWERLPSFHIRDMWRPGVACGLLWSFGNFFSLISVFYLGEGVGYPLVQTSILISGLWGIFYFGEVRGRVRIMKWFASSLLTVFGILLLSYEHHAT